MNQRIQVLHQAKITRLEMSRDAQLVPGSCLVLGDICERAGDLRHHGCAHYSS